MLPLEFPQTSASPVCLCDFDKRKAMVKNKQLRWAKFVGRAIYSVFWVSLPATLLLLSLTTTVRPAVATFPSQGCKLVHKYLDATGIIDLHMTLLEYDELLRHNPAINCIAWRIAGYDKEAVRLQFREFNVSSPSMSQEEGQSLPTFGHAQTCWNNMVYIRDSDSALASQKPAVSTIKGPYCGLIYEPFYWWSNGNDIIIEYHIRELAQARRDKMKYQFSVLTPMHGCGYQSILYLPSVSINSSIGEISSPFDRSVPTHARCYWSIVAPPGRAFLIEFTRYMIDPDAPFVLSINEVISNLPSEGGSTIIGPRCCDDATTTFPNNNIKSAFEEERCLCLIGIPPPVRSYSNVVHIYYESRGILTTVNQGFTLRWRHVEPLSTSSSTTTPEPSTASTTTLPMITMPPQNVNYFEEIQFYDNLLRDDDGKGSYVPAPNGGNLYSNNLKNGSVTVNLSSIVDGQEAAMNVQILQTTASSTIPTLYLDDEEIRLDRKNSILQEGKEMLPQNPGENGLEYYDGEEYKVRKNSGPTSTFGASSDETQPEIGTKNCCQLRSLMSVPCIVFVLGLKVLLAYVIKL